LRMFFDFIGIPGDSMVERSKVFCDRAKNNDNDNNNLADGLLAVLYSIFNIKRKELREKR
jgi:hypothetical protein